MIAPIGAVTKEITKMYAGVFTSYLEGLPLDRHYYPLYLLNERKTAPTQQELGEMLGAGKALMVRIIDYLADRDLVTRKPNPADRRCYLIELTNTGKELVPQIEKAMMKTDEVCLQNMNNREKQKAREILNTILTNLNSEPANEYDVEFSKRLDHE